MARNDIKYSILEQNSVEYEGPVEHVPVSADIGYIDDSVSVKEKLDALLILWIITTAKTILSGQCYVVADEIIIDTNGSIEIEDTGVLGVL
jgi:hypothetical protein